MQGRPPVQGPDGVHTTPCRRQLGGAACSQPSLTLQQLPPPLQALLRFS